MTRLGILLVTALAATLAGVALFRALVPAPQPQKPPPQAAVDPPRVAASAALPAAPDERESAPVQPPPPEAPVASALTGAIAPPPIVTQPVDSSRFPGLVDDIRPRFDRPELNTRVTLVTIDVVTLESAIRASQPFLSLANSDEADIGDPAQPDFAFQIDTGLTLNLKILRAFEYTDFIRSLNASGTVVSELGDIGDWTLTVNSSRDMVSGTIRTDERIYVFENTATPSVRFVADLDRSGFEGSVPEN
jgi:hypothetical protein